VATVGVKGLTVRYLNEIIGTLNVTNDVTLQTISGYATNPDVTNITN